MMMMMFPSGLFILLTLQLLSYNHNMVTAQCSPNNLETTQVLSTQLTMSWRCFDREADDELQVTYQLINRGQCDTGGGSVDPPFDYHDTQWGTWNRQVISGDTYQHSATLTNLLPYSTYRVSVQARQSDGRGGYNYGSTVNINPYPTSEAAPGTFGSESISYTPYANQLDFSWTIPCGSRNGLITGYLYILRDVNNNLITGATATEATSVTITGLSCDTTYRFEVAGTNSEGIGAYSEYKTATTTCCTRGPGPVGNLQTTYVSATEIRLSWTAPVDIGCPAQSRLQYVVTYTGDSLQDGCTLPTRQGSATIQDLDVTLSSLTPYYVYDIGIHAVRGEANRQTITRSTPQAVPGDVQTLQITAASSTSLDVSWDAPINECQPVSYTVATQLTNRDQCLPITDDPIIPAGSPTGLSYQVTGLIPYSSYTVYVTPVNTAGDGITSDVSGTTAQTAPGTFSAESISYTPYANQLYFSWTIPCGSRNGLITGYQYLLSDVNNNRATGTEAPSVTITGLSCDTTYRFSVAGINSAGIGAYSEYKTATTTFCTRVPMVYFNKCTYIVNEGDNLMVQILRAGGGGESINVGVRALNTNSALENEDYAGVPSEVIIPPGGSGMLEIPVFGDETTEGLETFDLMIVVGDTADYGLGNMRLGRATVIIADTSTEAVPNVPAVYFNKGTYVVNEGDTLMVQILRAGGGDESIDVDVVAVNTNSAMVMEDFSAPPSTVTIPPDASGMLNIPVFADQINEGLETFDLMIVVGDTAEYRLANMQLGRATVIIADKSTGDANRGTKSRKIKN